MAHQVNIVSQLKAGAVVMHPGVEVSMTWTEVPWNTTTIDRTYVWQRGPVSGQSVQRIARNKATYRSFNYC